MNFDVHSLETAPAEAREALQAAQAQYGFIPNLFGVMANAPPLLEAYRSLGKLFSSTSFSPLEQQVVLLAASAVNRCEYCMAAHSMAAKMHNMPEDVLRAMREGQPIEDERLEALRSLTEEIVETRGWPEPASIDAFLNAGFAPPQVFEIILGVGMKTLSNYTNHLAQTPLDPPFAPQAWTPPN